MQRMENFCRFEVSRTEMWLLGRIIFDTINTLEASEIANSGWRSTKWPPKMTWYHKIVYISKTVPPNRMQFAPNDPTSFLHQNTAAPWTDVIKADKKNKLWQEIYTTLIWHPRNIKIIVSGEPRAAPQATQFDPVTATRSLPVVVSAISLANRRESRSCLKLLPLHSASARSGPRALLAGGQRSPSPCRRIA